LYYAQSNTLANNTCNHNNRGISLYISRDNTLTSNTCSNNRRGISLQSSSGNILTYNNITDNIAYGVFIGWSRSNFNIIHHNNFINNYIQAYDDTGTNYWNTSTEGNYWSDWTSPDTNNDGIVDYPYQIDGGAGAMDYYPLVNPVQNAGSQIPVFTQPLVFIIVLILVGVIFRRHLNCFF
jgi:parallel beta-helix repeat protein